MEGKKPPLTNAGKLLKKEMLDKAQNNLVNATEDYVHEMYFNYATPERQSRLRRKIRSCVNKMRAKNKQLFKELLNTLDVLCNGEMLWNSDDIPEEITVEHALAISDVMNKEKGHTDVEPWMYRLAMCMYYSNRGLQKISFSLLTDGRRADRKKE